MVRFSHAKGLFLFVNGQAADVTIVGMLVCAVNRVSTLYKSNVSLRPARPRTQSEGYSAHEDISLPRAQMINLENVPLYARVSWPSWLQTVQRNTTEWSLLTRELTVSGNTIAGPPMRAQACSTHTRFLRGCSASRSCS